jgi:hypothetical protein
MLPLLGAVRDTTVGTQVPPGLKGEPHGSPSLLLPAWSIHTLQTGGGKRRVHFQGTTGCALGGLLQEPRLNYLRGLC